MDLCCSDYDVPRFVNKILKDVFRNENLLIHLK